MINNEYLYHFTSSENLIRILETMSLKLSDFKKLNDLNENNIPRQNAHINTLIFANQHVTNVQIISY